MLSRDLDDYIALQRARGLKFTTQPCLLRSFVAAATLAGDTHVTTARVLDWAVRTTSDVQARNRLAGLTRAELEQLVHHFWIYPLNSVVFMMPGAD